MPFSKNPDDIGTKLGPKLIHLISRTIIATKQGLLDTEHRARVHSMQTIIDQAGAEVADHYRDIMAKAIADRDLPPEIKAWFERTMSGKHQWQALAGYGLGASGATSALSTIISNYLAPGVRYAVSQDPQILPSPEELITMGVKGTMDWADVISYCHGAGWADFTIQAARIATEQYPAFAETLDLLRRGAIDEQTAQLYMTRNGIPAEIQPALLALERNVLSPADLADMVVRGIRTQDDAVLQAAQSGMNPTDFNDMVLDTGEPPGLMQMLEGYRRGFIDQATLERGIRQSRYRDEWIPLLEQLRFEPMSVADAVNAVVQNYLTFDQGNKIAELNGLEPGQFDILQQTAGEPLSRTEMSDLVNRGEATQDDFYQAMRESRLKDKYIPYAFALRRKVIPIFTLQKALKNGSVDHATAVQIAMESGYSQSDSEIIVAGGAADKLLPYKNKVVSSIETAVEDGMIAGPEASQSIVSLGFDQSEADFIVQAAELRQSAKIVTQVTNAIRSKYVQRHVDRQTASNDLDAIGVPASQRDYLLSLWDIELDANVRRLTEAQVVKAVTKQLITPDDGQARLVAMGYSPDDAALLLNGA